MESYDRIKVLYFSVLERFNPSVWVYLSRSRCPALPQIVGVSITEFYNSACAGSVIAFIQDYLLGSLEETGIG